MEFSQAASNFLPSEIFSLPERDDYLRTMSTYVHQSELAGYYRIAAGEVAPRTFRDLEDLVRKLELMSSGRAGHPLVLFTENVVQRACANGLEPPATDWSERIARNLDAQRSDPAHDEERAKLAARRAAKNGPTSADSERAALILQLEPSGPRPDRYLLSAWLYLGQSFVDKIYGSDNAVTLDQVRATVGDLIDQAVVRLGTVDSDTTELDLEFIVPRNLLDHPFEEWTNKAEDYMSLDVQFVVVVRDLVRQRDPTLHFRCRGRWKHMTNGVQTDDAQISRWVTCQERSGSRGALFRQLLADECVALGLTFPPVGEFSESELAEALDAGTPIAIWPRARCEHRSHAPPLGVGESCAGVRFKDQFCERLGARRLAELPRFVLELRQTAGGQDDSIGHVTLLWDDPNRRPEADFVLHVPPLMEGPS